MSFTFIDVQTNAIGNGARAAFGFSGSATMDGLVTNLSAVGEFSFISEANPEYDLDLSARGEFEFESSANISIDGSPDTFLSARGEFEFEGSVEYFAVQHLYARGLLEFTASSGAGNIAEPEVFSLNFLFDTPDVSRPFGNIGNYIYDMPRLRVNTVEIPIISATYTEPESSASATVEILLARPGVTGDRLIFDLDDDIDFGIGRKVSGVWDESSFVYFIGEGTWSASKYNVQWSDGPNDTIRVTISSNLDQKLLKTAQRDLSIFDPARETVDVSEVLPVYGTGGEVYYPEVVEKYGLSIHQLFQKVLIERCGFSAFQTNIPDYPIRRYDCAMGASLYQALTGLIGMWEPLIYGDAASDTIWLVDTSVTQPAGFPSGRAFSPSQYKALNQDTYPQQIDGIVVQYIEEVNAWDFETTYSAPDEVSNAGDTQIITKRQFKRYWREGNPNYVREVLDKETRETREYSFVPGTGTLLEKSVDDLTWTVGRLTKRVKTTDTLLPDLLLSTSSSIVMSLQRTQTETETYTYRTHPFKTRQTYLAKKLAARKGLIGIDSANPQFGQPAEQQLSIGYRSNNLIEGMTTRFGSVWSRQETSTPLRGGQVRTHVIEVDELKKLPILDYTEERAGDIGLNSLVPSDQRLVVWAEEDVIHIRTNQKLEAMHIGEVPISLGSALARRRLKQKKTKPHRMSLESIGFDRGLKRGSACAVKGRVDDGAPEPLGNYIILSRTVAISGSGDITSSFVAKEI